PTLVVSRAPPSASGLATKKFDGNPAAAALLRNVVLPRRPFGIVPAVQPVGLLHMNPSGFGLWAARYPRKLALVQFAPTYCDASPALDPFCPLKYARKIGSGEVPAAP